MLDAQCAHQFKIAAEAMIMIAGDIQTATSANSTRNPREAIPHRLALPTFKSGTFSLRRRRGYAPNERLGEVKVRFCSHRHSPG